MAFSELLKEFFYDNTSWSTDLEDFQFQSSGHWNDSLHKFWSEKKVIGEAFHTPDLKEGCQDTSLVDMNIEERYPFLWRVINSDRYPFFLKKADMFNFESMGVYYFLNDHTSPQRCAS